MTPVDDLRRLDAIRAELDHGNVGRLTIGDIRFLLDRLAAAESLPEALERLVKVGNNILMDVRTVEGLNPHIWGAFDAALDAAGAALKEQPRCPHGNGLSCRECQYEAEAEDATWD